MKHMCPVCGYPHLNEVPRKKGNRASFEICPSCGFQFGVSDDDAGHTFQEWRASWIERGMPWSSRQPTPLNWDAAAQVAKLPAARRALLGDD